jgi:hypothetical protein
MSAAAMARWQRPAIYLTAVSLYLLILGVGVLIIGLIGAIDMLTLSNCTDLVSGCPRQIVTGYYILAIAIAIVSPSLLGGLLLLRRHKNGKLIASISLVIWTGITLYGFYSYQQWYSSYGVIGWSIAFSFVAVAAVMDTFLAYAWTKKV